MEELFLNELERLGIDVFLYSGAERMNSTSIILLDIAFVSECKEGFNIFYETYSGEKVKVKKIILTHRYRDKTINTLSKKINKKICSAGIPIIGSLEEIKNIRYIYITLPIGSDDQEKFTFKFEIRALVSEERPFANFEIMFSPGTEGHMVKINTYPQISISKWLNCTYVSHGLYDDFYLSNSKSILIDFDCLSGIKHGSNIISCNVPIIIHGNRPESFLFLHSEDVIR